MSFQFFPSGGRPFSLKILLCAFLLVTFPVSASASLTRTKIRDLCKEADLVAIVKILSADIEHYSGGVCKAEIESPFKGGARGDSIFLSPALGVGIGGRYLVFLRRTEGISPYGSVSLSYGIIPVLFRTVHGVSSMMEVRHTCVFGRGASGRQCGIGVKLAFEYVILPKKIELFRITEDQRSTFEDDDYYRWARLEDIVSLLNGFREF